MTIAEKLAKVYENTVKIGNSGGGSVKPTTPTDNRTDMAYWYQYLAKDYQLGYWEDDYIDEFKGTVYEELELPRGTQNVTSFRDFLKVICSGGYDSYYNETRIRTKKIKGVLDMTSVIDANCLFYKGDGIPLEALDVELINTSKVEDFGSLFAGQELLTSVPSLDTSSVKYAYCMFQDCKALRTPLNPDLRNATNISSIFRDCHNVPSIEVDIRNVTNHYYTGYAFANCYAVTKLRVKNAIVPFQIGSGNTYGHLVDVDSLLYTIYHLRTAGTIRTLTMGSVNLDKLANVYVRTIDITDAMRAEDEFIDKKLPFEVCESTDEGAMLITDYVAVKNWALK